MHLVYFWGNVPTPIADAVRWVMLNYEYALDDYYPDINFDAIEDTSFDGVTDVAVRITYVPPSGASTYWAWTQCEDDVNLVSYGGSESNSTRWCKPQQMWWNMNKESNFDTTTERRAVGCHEFGHTLGLRHATTSNHPSPNSTCMKANQNTITTTHAHDRLELVDFYD